MHFNYFEDYYYNRFIVTIFAISFVIILIINFNFVKAIITTTVIDKFIIIKYNLYYCYWDNFNFINYKGFLDFNPFLFKIINILLK